MDASIDCIGREKSMGISAQLKWKVLIQLKFSSLVSFMPFIGLQLLWL